MANEPMDKLTRELLLDDGWKEALRGDGQKVMHLPAAAAASIAGDKAAALASLRAHIHPVRTTTPGGTHIEITTELFNQWRKMAEAEQHSAVSVQAPVVTSASASRVNPLARKDSDIQPLKTLINSPGWFKTKRGDKHEVWRLPLEGATSEDEAKRIATPLQSLLKGIRTELVLKGTIYHLEVLPDSVTTFEMLRPHVKPLLFVVEPASTTIGAYTDIGVRDVKGSREELEDGLVARSVPPLNDAPRLTRQIMEVLIAETSSHRDTGATVDGVAIQGGNVTILNLGDSRVASITYTPENGAVLAKLLTEDHTPSSEFKIFSTDEMFWVEWLGRVITTDARDRDIGINHSIGDAAYGPAVSKEADITSYDLGVSDKDSRKLIMLASDGAFGRTELNSHAVILSEMFQRDPNTHSLAAN